MALTHLQRTVCRLLAANRVASGESYVAGGAALNELIAASRVSRDVDVFHDTDAALAASWAADRHALEAGGYGVDLVRERPGLVEAEVIAGDERLRFEWARDSAYRFFPLLEHPEFGLTLHPFDLATNKVLALVGRLEVRDWVDVLASDERIQPLGYLAWAASAKDPGFGPGAILDGAARSARYSAEEVSQLAFAGEPPDAADLSRRWHRILGTARRVIELLPPEDVGACVLDHTGSLLRLTPDELDHALRLGNAAFHHGRIGGAMPRLVSGPER
jgi:hypothetical protein